jgi:hypothetical protein
MQVIGAHIEFVQFPPTLVADLADGFVDRPDHFKRQLERRMLELAFADVLESGS